ncbi:MAG: hypothetical protein ACE5G1_17820, partial [bacterium]
IFKNSFAWKKDSPGEPRSIVGHGRFQALPFMGPATAWPSTFQVDPVSLSLNANGKELTDSPRAKVRTLQPILRE